MLYSKNFMCVSFGPQHPAAHGVLRLMLYLEGEKIKYVDPHIGLLHRGTEKLMEQRNILQSLPYFDRLDYVTAMAQEHTFTISFEQLTNVKISKLNSIIRVMFLEITRILNHLMALTTHAMDIGAFTPFLWGFEEREGLMNIYEEVCGARLHSAYILPGGIRKGVTNKILYKIINFCYNFNFKLNSLDEIIYSNPIWFERLNKIGIVNKKFISNYSFSGPLIRSSGLLFDLRKNAPYEIYDNLDFNIVCCSNGDSYSRFIVRFLEMRESIRIIIQCCNLILNNNKKELSHFKLKNYSSIYSLVVNCNILTNNSNLKRNFFMEDTINYFKHFIKNNYKAYNINNCYMSTETPKGEFGVFVGINNNNINRYKIRSTGFYHLQSIADLCNNLYLADIVSIIGTVDLVFGEVDR